MGPPLVFDRVSRLHHPSRTSWEVGSTLGSRPSPATVPCCPWTANSHLDMPADVQIYAVWIAGLYRGCMVLCAATWPIWNGSRAHYEIANDFVGCKMSRPDGCEPRTGCLPAIAARRCRASPARAEIMADRSYANVDGLKPSLACRPTLASPLSRESIERSTNPPHNLMHDSGRSWN